MKTKNITFSMPIELIDKLQAIAGKRNMSKFVTIALKRAIGQQELNLRTQYKAAEKDPGRKKTILEWGALDTEGWDE